ncbi:hypothetical protein [Stenotrophomonas hibiscicola]|uniref:hypothetical protein n=1 Tax=Stenotrophomonas hibiscicola TaxID=86189 RepID=UPI003D0C085B
MRHDLWPELRAAASETSGLNVHEYASKLLLQLNRDLTVLPDPGLFGKKVSVTDTRFLDLAAGALKVADGLRARATRAGAESSAFHQELNTVLRQVESLFRRLDMDSPQETLDRYYFNEAALDWMDTLGIHPASPGSALHWTRQRKLMPLEEIHRTILRNDSLLKAMLSPPAPKTTEEWVREARHWQTLRRAWVPVLEEFCTQSATISGELEPV